jgi:beta-glucosidase
MKFPKNFIWGAATAAFQIEGANTEDGRCESIWDNFSKVPGNIMDGSDGSKACDHYHRWPEDMDIAKALNLDAYRFSVSWPRIQPTLDGNLNQKGIDFYSRLVDGMLERGIKPFLTLYHWDLPQYLQDIGGWANRDIADRFADYAQLVTQHLGDRVDSIATFNESFNTAYLGHWLGVHAPGHKNPAESIQVTHNVLLAHGRAIRAMRAQGTKAMLGFVPNLVAPHSASQSPEDLRATARHDLLQNRLYLDPIFLGHYPEKMEEMLGVAPKIEAGDMKEISEPIDFLGVNYYRRLIGSASGVAFSHFLRNKDDSKGVKDTEFQKAVQLPPGAQVTVMGWEVYHEGLRECLELVKNRYPNVPPMYVTESGCAYEDQVQEGEVRDEQRIAYIEGQIAAVGRALANGVDVRGYFVWSLLDNFEWALGYTKRFGLTHIDYETQKRTVKASGHWYKKFIAGQR